MALSEKDPLQKFQPLNSSNDLENKGIIFEILRVSQYCCQYIRVGWEMFENPYKLKKIWKNIKWCINFNRIHTNPPLNIQ